MAVHPEGRGRARRISARPPKTLGSVRRRGGGLALLSGALFIGVGYLLTSFSKEMSDDGFDVYIGAYVVGGLLVLRGLYEIVGSSFALPGVPLTGAKAALNTIEKGYLIAAGSAVVLLIAMSALSWFSVIDTGGSRREEVPEMAMNAWAAMEYFSRLLFIVAAFAIAVAVSRRIGRPIKFKFATNAQIIFSGALLGVLALMYSAFNPKDPSNDVTGYERNWAYESEVLPGLWVGVLILLAIAWGAWMARADSGAPPSQKES